MSTPTENIKPQVKIKVELDTITDPCSRWKRKVWFLTYLLFFSYQQCPTFRVLKLVKRRCSSWPLLPSLWLLLRVCLWLQWVCVCVVVLNKGLQQAAMTRQDEAASDRLVRKAWEPGLMEVCLKLCLLKAQSGLKVWENRSSNSCSKMCSGNLLWWFTAVMTFFFFF